VNIDDAKTNLWTLLERVERGEEIVIARAGRPIARLCPLPARRRQRRLGKFAGKSGSRTTSTSPAGDRRGLGRDLRLLLDAHRDRLDACSSRRPRVDGWS
jgi:prevent-host-death family protein